MLVLVMQALVQILPGGQHTSAALRRLRCPLCRMEEMRLDCLAALRTQRMPTTRNEEYRFTDIAPILQLEPQVSHQILPACSSIQ